MLLGAPFRDCDCTYYASGRFPCHHVAHQLGERSKSSFKSLVLSIFNFGGNVRFVGGWERKEWGKGHPFDLHLSAYKN